MFDELRKRSIKKVLPAVIILCLAGIVVLGFSVKGFLNVLGGNKTFEELKPEEIKDGMYVEAHIKENFGMCIEETESREGSSYERHVASYYVIWTGDDYVEDYSFMTIKVPTSYDTRMEKMAEAFYYGEETETITFTGRVEKMDEEEFELFKDYVMEGFECTEDEFEEYTIPYNIVVEGANGKKVGSCVFFAAGVGLLLWGILFMIATVKGGRLKQLRKEIMGIGYTDERVEADYARKREICAAPKMYVGQELLFFNEGAVPHVLRQRDVVWLYYGATAQRVNGIKVATTYTLNVALKSGKIFALGVATKEKAIQAVESLAKAFPWAVAGYTEQIAALYRSNMPEFLNIVYNSVPEDTFAQTAATFEEPSYEEPIR